MNIDSYIGAPYDEHDCWGLVRDIFEREAHIRLDEDIYKAAPDFSEIWYDGESEMPSLKPFDILVMRRYRPYAEHVGLVVDETHFMHARPRMGATIERIEKWRHKVLQVARHRLKQ